MSGQNAYLKVRGFRLAQRRTSVSLEDAFWEATRAIAAERGMSIQNLIAEIDAARCDSANLSSAIRIFVVEYYKGLAAGDGQAGTPRRTAASPPGATPSTDASHSPRPAPRPAPRTTDRPQERLSSWRNGLR